MTQTTFSVPALMGAIMSDRRGDGEQHPAGDVRQRAAARRGEDAADGRAGGRLTRLRPVIMTALAMIIGMLPMALGLGEGGEQNAPLGRAVIGGLLRGDGRDAVLRAGGVQRAAAKAAAGRDSNGRGENGKGAAEEVPAGEKAAGATGEAVMSNSSGIEQEPAAAEPSHVDHSVPRARTRTMQVIGLGILVLFAVLLVVSVIPRVINRHRLAKAAQSVRTAVTSVHVVSPVAASEAGLSIAATTQAMQDAIIYARTSGYVRKRYVDIGDDVKAGQLLAEIDSPEIDQQLMQARADLRQAERNLDLQKATLDLNRVTMDRYKGADEEGAVAVEAVDQSVSAYRTAEAAVAAAEASVESNRANVQRLVDLTGFQRVVAPFAGTVIQRNVDVGTLVTAGSPTDNTAVAPTSVTGQANGLFEVARIDELRVFVNVPQVYAPNVKVGLPVEVTVRGQLQTPVTGTVTRTARALDPATRTLLTEVDIPNPTHRMLPGMFVYVAFKIGPSGIRLRVPATAVIVDAKGTRVAIVGRGIDCTFYPVVLGRDFGDVVDIQEGLAGGETIVAQPTVSLQEGQVVNPIAAKGAGS